MNADATAFLVGVDGGGTGCRAAIADATGRRLGEATGGPANFTTDADQTLHSVQSALKVAAAQAHLPEDWAHHCAAHIGLAGIMTAQDQTRVARALPFKRIAVSDDRLTFLAGALGERDGMLAAIGTGTIVAGQRAGLRRFYGGWGPHLADQASGGWLGRHALRRVMLAHDGLTEHTALTRLLLAKFDTDPNAIVTFSRDAKPGDVAGLAPLIIEAADNADPVARSLLETGARYLRLCIENYGLKERDVLCLAGGIGPYYADYLPPVYQSRLAPCLGSALDGALRLAGDQAA